MADTIFVKSGLKTEQVALWEVDERHPGGEVYIAGLDNEKANPAVKVPAVEVFKTPLVMKYLGEGRLVEVNKGGTQVAAAPKKEGV